MHAMLCAHTTREMWTAILSTTTRWERRAEPAPTLLVRSVMMRAKKGGASDGAQAGENAANQSQTGRVPRSPRQFKPTTQSGNEAQGRTRALAQRQYSRRRLRTRAGGPLQR